MSAPDLTKPKYTPGPWEARLIKEGHLDIYPVGCSHDRVPIAVLDHSRDGHEPTRVVTTPADARLIAAAPDLLEALHRMLVSFAGQDEELCMECGEKQGTGPTCYTCYVIGKAVAAVQKAEGEE
jgi:hypothetical protein